MRRGISYVGARKQKRAQDQLQIAEELGAQVESANSSKRQLHGLRHFLEEARDGLHDGAGVCCEGSKEEEREEILLGACLPGIN